MLLANLGWIGWSAGMRLKGTTGGLVRLEAGAAEVEADELLPVEGDADRLRLVGDESGIVALESVDVFRAGEGLLESDDEDEELDGEAGIAFLVGESESESELESELEDEDDDALGRAFLVGALLSEELSEPELDDSGGPSLVGASLSESLEEDEDEDEDDFDSLGFLAAGASNFNCLAFLAGKGSASDSESELDNELSELDPELDELEPEDEAFRFIPFVLGISSDLELADELDELDELEDVEAAFAEDEVDGDVAFETLASESLEELLLSPSLLSLSLAFSALTTSIGLFCASSVPPLSSSSLLSEALLVSSSLELPSPPPVFDSPLSSALPSDSITPSFLSFPGPSNHSLNRVVN